MGDNIAWGQPSKFFIKNLGEDSFTELGVVSDSVSFGEPIQNHLYGEIPKICGKIRQDHELDFEAILNPSPEQQRLYEELTNIMARDIQESLNEFYRQCYNVAEVLMRTVVMPPIKGKVTIGKIRHRGLRMAFGHDSNGLVFYGLVQRGKILYTPVGEKLAVENGFIVGPIEK